MLTSRIPSKKRDLVADLYSTSALTAYYDEMSQSGSSDIFRLLNT
jgi:hypothetical protein